MLGSSWSTFKAIYPALDFSGLAEKNLLLVDIYCSEELGTDLEQLGEELRFVMITSGVQLHPLEDAPGLYVLEK